MLRYTTHYHSCKHTSNYDMHIYIYSLTASKSPCNITYYSQLLSIIMQYTMCTTIHSYTGLLPCPVLVHLHLLVRDCGVGQHKHVTQHPSVVEPGVAGRAYRPHRALVLCIGKYVYKWIYE